jgi:hypothetical protein
MTAVEEEEEVEAAALWMEEAGWEEERMDDADTRESKEGGPFAWGECRPRC